MVHAVFFYTETPSWKTLIRPVHALSNNSMTGTMYMKLNNNTTILCASKKIYCTSDCLVIRKHKKGYYNYSYMNMLYGQPANNIHDNYDLVII